MSIAYVDDIFVSGERDEFTDWHPEQREASSEDVSRLVAELLERHVAYESDDQSVFFDPIEGLSVLKYHLIGDPRPLARYNLTFPPGVARQTARGGRVYGVECAALVDARTGWVDILRKDDIVDSHDTTDWMLARYNTLTGEYEEPHILGVAVDKQPTGDMIQFRIDPPNDYRAAHQGPSTLTITLDKMYHASGELISTRAKYYGRGTGQEPPLLEGTYSHDISLLFTELERQMQERGIPVELLDRGARPYEPIRPTEFGRHVLQLDTWRV